jgi:hypothetical protein
VADDAGSALVHGAPGADSGTPVTTGLEEAAAGDQRVTARAHEALDGASQYRSGLAAGRRGSSCPCLLDIVRSQRSGSVTATRRLPHHEPIG